MIHIKLYESFILEGKVDDIKNKYSKSLSRYDIEALCSMIPNSSNIIDWILKVFENERESFGKNPINDQYLLIDILIDYFTRFDRIKRNIPVNKRDITQFKNVKELISVVDQYNDYDKILRDKDVDMILNNEMWLVFVPKTFRASKKWGWVKFCTTYDEYYFNYHNINKKSLVYIIHKFDNTMNTSIECFPDNKYKIWNYLNDISGASSIYELEHELSNIDDGYLDIDTIISELPIITQDNILDHIILFLGNESITEVNEIIGTDIRELTKKGIREYLSRSGDSIFTILNGIRDFV